MLDSTPCSVQPHPASRQPARGGREVSPWHDSALCWPGWAGPSCSMAQGEGDPNTCQGEGLHKPGLGRQARPLPGRGPGW